MVLSYRPSGTRVYGQAQGLSALSVPLLPKPHERQYGQSWSIITGLACHVGTSKIKSGQPRTGLVLPEKFEIIEMELEHTELDGMRVILSGGLSRTVIRAFSYMNRKG